MSKSGHDWARAARRLPQTHALSPGSFAIDAGYAKYCLDADQRGVARPIDGDADGVARCDMGAYEYEGATGGGPRGDDRHPYWHHREKWFRMARGPASRSFAGIPIRPGGPARPVPAAIPPGDGPPGDGREGRITLTPYRRRAVTRAARGQETRQS